MHLQGQVEADAFVAGAARQVVAPLADLLRAPQGKRDRQLLRGAAVTVYEERDGWAYLQAQADDYVGYVRTASLGEAEQMTHWVAAPASHAYSEPDIKSPEIMPLYFGAPLRVVSHMPKFYETDDGHYVPKPALRPLDRRFTDPATVAQLFFGAPFLWGGNSFAGIDCSGLIQAALLAAGQTCPGDSDQQEAALGRAMDDGEPLERGDLVFWRGHVAMAVDHETLIHANAFTMSVAYEPAAQAIKRIAAQGDGPVTSRKRLG
jgi:cell wall-associated NlpC family hydrolase